MPRTDLIKSIYFVLALKLRKYYQEKNVWLYERVTTLSNDRNFSPRFEPTVNYTDRLRKRSEKPENKTNVRISRESLMAAWNEKITLIGVGRTGFVCKLQVGSVILALKLVDPFKTPEDALEELENEYNVLSSLKGSNILLKEYPKTD